MLNILWWPLDLFLRWITGSAHLQAKLLFRKMTRSPHSAQLNFTNNSYWHSFAPHHAWFSAEVYHWIICSYSYLSFYSRILKYLSWVFYSRLLMMQHQDTGVTPMKRWLSLSPVYHAFAFWVFLERKWCGGTVLLHGQSAVVNSSFFCNLLPRTGTGSRLGTRRKIKGKYMHNSFLHMTLSLLSIWRPHKRL